MRRNEAPRAEACGFPKRNTTAGKTTPAIKWRGFAPSKYKALVIFIFYSCLLLSLAEAGQELAFDNPSLLVSMDFQDVNLKDILKVFSVQSGLNFIASDTVQGRMVTLYLDKVPIKEAMEKLFKVSNLTYELDRESEIFIVKDWGKPKMETQTRVFRLKYASVSNSSLKDEKAGSGLPAASAGITDAVKQLLSEHGSLIEDARTNSLIVIDIPSRIPIIASAIEGLDVRIPQIMLEVEMLDVSKNDVDKLGFNWEDASEIAFTVTPATAKTFFPWYNLIQQTVNKGTIVTKGDLEFSALTLVFDFLKKQTDTRYLARPRILTLNNETAEIKITTNETVGVNSTVITGASSSNAVSAERAETGITLRVTPQVNPETGEITMFVAPKVKDVSKSVFTNSNQYYYDPEERSTKSLVRIKDGETVIIGGLIRHDKNESVTKLPFLGDIPLLGAAFRNRDKTKDKERELLVFITPRIVKEDASGAQIRQAKNSNIPLREQSVSPLIDRQAVISRYMNNAEGKH